MKFKVGDKVKINTAKHGVGCCDGERGGCPMVNEMMIEDNGKEAVIREVIRGKFYKVSFTDDEYCVWTYADCCLELVGHRKLKKIKVLSIKL